MFRKLFVFIIVLFARIWPYRYSHSINTRIRSLRGKWLGPQMKKWGNNVLVGKIGLLKGLEYISVGDLSSFDDGIILTAWDMKGPPVLSIGKHCAFGAHNHITCVNCISIGDNCLTGKWVTITDNSHGDTGFNSLNQPPYQREIISKGPVIIGKNVWIGDKVTILPDVTIGDGAVIAANSVVTHNVPPYSIVAGIPARIVRLANPELMNLG